jgi:hypothetical protein
LRDLQQRFADHQAEYPDLLALNPNASFELADDYASEQRQLTIGTVLLAISLFWLGLAEMLTGRARSLNFTIGVGVYLLGLLYFIVVEAIAIYGRGGVL